MNQARVTSTDAVKDFKEALVAFTEQARDALVAIQMESRRTLDRLLFELPNYWERRLKEGERDLAEAKSELFRVQLQRTSGERRVDDVEQKKAVERAKRQIEIAQEKLELVRQWGRTAQRAVEEYESRARRLADLVEGDPPPSVLFMNRVLDSLDAYLKVAPAPGSTARTTVAAPPAPKSNPSSGSQS